MSNPFLSEIRIMSFNFPPKGWAFCNGQLLPINQNQALFALLGTTYGGNGQTNFQLPNLQARLPLHTGNGFTIGQSGGEQAHTLAIAELPAHTHPANCTSALGNQASPSGTFWAQDNNGNAPYSHSGGSTLATGANGAGGAITYVGGSQPHQNMAPYLTLNFCIALQGIFPSQT